MEVQSEAGVRLLGSLRRLPSPRRARLDGAPAADGSVTAEIVVLLPAMMLLLVGVLQFALAGLASHALTLAVADAGATARSSGASLSSAPAVLRRLIGSLGGDLVSDLRIRVTETTGGTVTVAARGTVVSLLPGLHLPISARSVGPRQEFRASG